MVYIGKTLQRKVYVSKNGDMMKIRTQPWLQKMVHKGEQVYVADRYKRYEARCADATKCVYTYTQAKTPLIKGQKAMIESNIDGDLIF